MSVKMFSNTSRDMVDTGEEGEAHDSDYYFDSYAHFGVHEEMLKDGVRTRAYMDSIMNNKHLFKGKIVLDVGCGTGILSMFAAKAGAKRVYAVEHSGIAEQAEQIVAINGFADVIKIMRCKVEDVELDCGPGNVDIIVSEWMGYFLLYESMLDSVLVARDKWLNKSTGIMMPDKAEMFLTGIEDAKYKQEKIHFWDNVYGFRMDCVKEMVFNEPLIDTVSETAVFTSPCKLLELDLLTMKREEVSFSSNFTLIANRDEYCHAFLVHFDVHFSKCHTKVTLSTAPWKEYTHWKQCVFYIREDLMMKKGEKVSGVLRVGQNAENKRNIDVEIVYEFLGEIHSVSTKSRYLIC